MKIKLVGVKEFRSNMAKYTKEAARIDTRVIILNKNEPVFEIKPIDKKEIAMKKLEEEIAEAREQVKKGEVVSHEEIMKEFGLL